jgi:hypothetical protein
MSEEICGIGPLADVPGWLIGGPPMRPAKVT